MTPETLLESVRESTGPDADARARLMGRLAALGPPEQEAVAERPVWPWIAAAVTLAAAAVAWWAVPAGQPLSEASTDATQASDRASVSDPQGVAAPTPTPRATRPPSPVGVAAPPKPEPAVVMEPEPSAVPPAASAKPAPKPRKSARAPVALEPPPAKAPDTLAAEAALISQARSALADGNPAATLKHLREYSTRFEAPALAEEAAALRAMARCAHEGPDAAVGSAFVRSFPRSMFRKRVRKSCSAENETE